MQGRKEMERSVALPSKVIVFYILLWLLSRMQSQVLKYVWNLYDLKPVLSCGNTSLFHSALAFTYRWLNQADHQSDHQRECSTYCGHIQTLLFKKVQ